jgi:hypothetical protein
MIRSAILVGVLVAACGGGKAKPETVDNHGGVGMADEKLALLPGMYPCAFMFQGHGFGPFKCTVAGNHVTKEGGMTPWNATISAIAGGVHLEAKGDCKKDDEFCSDFSADLVKGANGVLKGKVVGRPDWWLTDQELQIRNAGMGGDQYAGVKADE